MSQKPLVILIHEIYGVNSHMKKMARLIKMAGYDVVTPNLLGDQEVYSLKEEKAAYEQFSMHNRLTAGENIIRKLIVRNKNAGRIIYVIGFSAGATIAWKCSSMPEVSGAVCYYGSRIRDHLDIHPACPVLLFFPAYEPSFEVSNVITHIKKKENRFISLYQFDAFHGFANPDSAYFDRAVFFKVSFYYDRLIEGKKKPAPFLARTIIDLISLGRSHAAVHQAECRKPLEVRRCNLFQRSALAVQQLQGRR